MILGRTMCNSFVSKIGFMFFFVVVVAVYNYAVMSTLAHLKFLNATYTNDSNTSQAQFDSPPPGYLVWSKNCRMPDEDSWKDAVRMYERKNYTACSNELPLTSAVFQLHSRRYSLHIDESAKKSLIGSYDDVSCCYQSISRQETDDADKDYKLETCVPFTQDYLLPPDVDSVIVICKSKQTGKEVQRDAHSLVREKSEIRHRLQAFATNTNGSRPVSVLMLGIDSVSRFNLRRAMPNTTRSLLKSKWFELSGYNKYSLMVSISLSQVDTFPNLMAILSGYSMATVSAKCNLKKQEGLKNCNMIWDTFRKNGYVTGFGEDEARMSTFNYMLKGFKWPPVDYYLRPFMLAIENSLEIQRQSRMTFCIGLRHSADYVFDHALELATRYRSEPYFGLFWVSTFSNNSFDDPTSMDLRVVNYLTEMEARGILDDSVVVLFSDHGMRFGKERYLRQGFLDERLPFIFIWLPHWLRVKYPEFVTALRMNQYRLTNPYDIHMTLKHIIELSGRTESLPPAADCPNCQSLLMPVPKERSCKDIAIEEHWCTCTLYENVGSGNPNVRKAVAEVLTQLNVFLELEYFIPPCSYLVLKSIDDAQKKVNMKWEKGIDLTTEIYRVQFTVNSQNAKFEATVAVSNAGKKPEIIGSISRLDSYRTSSTCMKDKILKKYCICITY